MRQIQSDIASWVRRFFSAAEFREWRHFSGVMLFALFARIVRLSGESLWYDELTTLQYIRAPSLSEFLKSCEKINPVAPYNLYLMLQYWLGPDPERQRHVAVLFGMVSLAALYGLSRYLFNARVALIAVAWTSVMPWHVYYSQEIRYYGLVLALAILSMWAFARMVSRPSIPFTVINLLFNLMLMHVHMLAAVVAAAQGVFLLIYRPRWRGLIFLWTALQVPSLVFFYNYFTSQSDRIQDLVGWVSPPKLLGGEPSLQEYVTTMSGYDQSSGTQRPVPLNSLGLALEPALLFFKYALLLACASGAGFGFASLFLNKSNADSDGASTSSPLTPRETAGFLLCWAVIPVAVLFAGSSLLRPMFLVRYTFFAMIPIYIAIAYAISRVRYSPLRLTMVAFPIVFFIGFHFPGPYRVPFKDIVTTLRANADRKSDPVVYLRFDTDRLPIGYYWRGGDPIFKGRVETSRVVEGSSRVPSPVIWFVLNPPLTQHFVDRLSTRGKVTKIWQFPSSRSMTMLQWLPNADQLAPPEIETTKQGSSTLRSTSFTPERRAPQRAKAEAKY